MAKSIIFNELVRNAVAYNVNAWTNDPTSSAAKKTIAKSAYESGVDSWVSKLFAFLVGSYPELNDASSQNDVNNAMTAIFETYIKTRDF